MIDLGLLAVVLFIAMLACMAAAAVIDPAREAHDLAVWLMYVFALFAILAFLGALFFAVRGLVLS